MKSGNDPEQLAKDFKDWQARQQSQDFTNHRAYVNPIEHLRNMVPANTSQRQSSFDCDPALVDHEGCDEQWDQYLQEAPEAMQKFNRELRLAVNLDEQNGKTIT